MCLVLTNVRDAKFLTSTLKKILKRTPAYRPLRFIRNFIDAKTEKTVSGFCWLLEDGDFHTTYSLYNYWSENYGINDNFTVKCVVYAQDGSVLAVMDIPLDHNSVKVVHGYELLKRGEIESPFEGSVVFTATDTRLRANIPFQCDQDFYYQKSKMTSVHGLGMFTEPVDVSLPATVPIHASSTEDPYVVFQNTYEYSKSPDECITSIEIELFDSSGSQYAQSYFSQDVPACGLSRISLKSAFPDIEDFLNGRPGVVRIWSKIPATRYLVYHTNSDRSSMSVCHLVGISKPHPDPIAPSSELVGLGRGMMHGLPAFTGSGVETEAIVYTANESVDELDVDVDLYAVTGELIGSSEAPIQLGRYGNHVVRTADVLQKLNVATPSSEFKGMMVLSIKPSKKSGVIPRYQSTSLRMTEGVYSGEVILNMDLFNVDTANSAWSPRYQPIQRTKTFSRVIVDHEWETYLWISNPSSLRDEYAKEAEYTVRLFGQSGEVASPITKTLPAHGSEYIAISDLFPDAENYLSNNGGYGAVRLRDTNVRLWCLYVIKNKNTGAISCDHLYGG